MRFKKLKNFRDVLFAVSTGKKHPNPNHESGIIWRDNNEIMYSDTGGSVGYSQSDLREIANKIESIKVN